MNLQRVLRGTNGTYVDIGPVDQLRLAVMDFTVEAWIKTAANTMPFLVLLGAQSSATALRLCVESGRLVMYGSDVGASGNIILQPDRWYHIAFRHVRASGERSLFVNGILDRKFAGLPPPGGSGAAFVGRASSAAQMNTCVAEFRVWGYARTSAQIRETMFRRLSGAEAGLMRYLPLDDGAGNMVRDGRPQAPSATIYNAFTWENLNDLILRKGTGKAVERAVVSRFDSAGARVECFADALTQPSVVEAWVRPTNAGAPDASPIVSKREGGSGFELGASTTHASFQVWIGGQVYPLQADGLEPGFWNHVAGYCNGSTLALYVNGIRRQSMAIPTPASAAGPLMLGRNAAGDRQYRGDMAEVRLWSTPFEPIDRMYQRSHHTALVASWRLEADGRDHSANARDGQVLGARWALSELPLADSNDVLLAGMQLPEQLSLVTAQLNERELAVGTLTKQLATANDTVKQQVSQIQTLQTTISNNQKQIADLQADIQALSAAGGAQTSYQKLYTNAHEEILRARAELAKSGQTYSLGKVTFDMKMLPGPGGIGMSFPQLADLKGLDSTLLSSVHFEFDSQEEKPPPAPVLDKIPSLLGYTEAMARRKIAEAGYLVEVSSQAVVSSPDKPVEVDRVVNQYPRPGTNAKLGTSILIFIGRES